MLKSVAAAVAGACLLAGLWTPVVWAEEAAPVVVDTAPSSDGSGPSNGTPSSESQPSSTDSSTASEPAGGGDSQPTGSESVSGADEGMHPGSAVEQVAVPETPADKAAGGETRWADSTAGAGSASGGGDRFERSPEANGQRATGSAAGGPVAPVSQGTGLPIAGVLGTPPASGATGIADAGTIALGGAGVEPGVVAAETGGMQLLLASPLACGMIPCYGGSVGTFGSAVMARNLHERAATENSVSKATELPLISIPGSPGQPRGPFFSLLGGGGGTAAGFMLFSLVAVLAGWLVRRTDLTTAFRLPAAAWPPPVYVPPIESPG